MVLLNLRNRRGQGVTIEYAVLFFIVIAAVTVMSTYIKRGMQGRVRSARNYMALQVNAEYGPHHNEVMRFEYEPYYTKTATEKVEHTVTTEDQRAWAGHEGNFMTGTASSVVSQTTSVVAPAADAN